MLKYVILSVVYARERERRNIDLSGTNVCYVISSSNFEGAGGRK